MERLVSTFKHELGLEDAVGTRISSLQLQRDLGFRTDGFLNRECWHSTLSYLSAINYEQQCIGACKLTAADP